MPAGTDPLVHIIPNVVAEKMPPVQYQPYYMAAAQRYGVPVDLLARQGWQESRFDPNAVSGKKARGIAQFMPDTARQYGVDVTDPESSIHGQARYMRDLYDRFQSWPGATAAYIAGPGRAAGWRQTHGEDWTDNIPESFEQTRDYVVELDPSNVVPPVFPQAVTMLPADAPYQPWNAPPSGGTPRSRLFGGPRSSGVHAGLDVPAPAGMPITAHIDGRVLETRRSNSLYGNIIDVQYNDGTIHRFAHLGQDPQHASRVPYYRGQENAAAYGPGIRTGARFTAGQVLGYVGGSGTRSGWPHIHTELFPTRSGYDAYNRNGRTMRGRVDPQAYWEPAAPPNIDELVPTVAPSALLDDVTVVPAFDPASPASVAPPVTMDWGVLQMPPGSNGNGSAVRGAPPPPPPMPLPHRKPVRVPPPPTRRPDRASLAPRRRTQAAQKPVEQEPFVRASLDQILGA